MRSIGKCLIALVSALVWLEIVQALSSASSTSPTFDGGTLTTDTWLTPTQSPYTIVQDIFVPAGIKLTLEPGTVLKMCSGCSIFVQGQLMAAGTPQQPITLTHDQDGEYWGTVGFWRTNSDNNLTHLVIEYASSALYNGYTLPGVAAMTSSLTIEHSQIRHMQDNAVNLVDSDTIIRDSAVFDVTGVEVIHVSRGYAEIERNRIYDGHYLSDGIDFDGDGTTTGVIRDNLIYDHADDCVDLGWGSSPIIEANILYNCGDKGLSVGEWSNPAVLNNLIYNAVIGLASKDGSHPTLINNTIVSNTVGISLYRTFAAQPGDATVYNSIIWGSDTAIDLQDGAQITITYSNVETTTAWTGKGNINADPRFWAPGAFDFRLRATSPCTDTANPAIAPDTDIRGIPRPHGDGVDMGAFEFFERVWMHLPLIVD